jgi:hypothetical protein
MTEPVVLDDEQALRASMLSAKPARRTFFMRERGKKDKKSKRR